MQDPRYSEYELNNMLVMSWLPNSMELDISEGFVQLEYSRGCKGYSS